MSARATLLSIALLAVSSSAQDSQTPDVQVRAQALLQHARKLSDIRSPGAPAFRLKATFSFVGDNLDTVQGTYTETWVSDSQWRRETVIGDQRYIDVGVLNKHWLVFPDAFPRQANKLATVMAFLPPASLDLVFDSVNERTAADLTADCAFAKPAMDNFRFAFCFEKKTGLLLEKVFPEKRPQNLLSLSCEYGKFQKFGNYTFPREINCFEDRHKSITATVVELSIASPVDPALFDPPPGAIQLGYCSTKTIPPARYANAIMPPWVDPENVVWLEVWFVVDEKGKPQDLRVLRTVDKHTHENAWNTVQSWRFKPGTCDGKPMPMPLTLEIPSAPH